MEMGGIEPPSRTASRQLPTRVVGILCAVTVSYRRDAATVSRTVLGDRAPANLITAPFLSDARTRSRKVRSGRTRYLEVSDLGSERKTVVRSSSLPVFTRARAPRRAFT